MYLEPLQAWMAAYCNSTPPRESRAWTILRIFLPAAPLSGFLSPEYTIFKLFGNASRPLCADFHLAIQQLRRLQLLLAAPSDFRRRQRQLLDTVEDRGEQSPCHSHLGRRARTHHLHPRPSRTLLGNEQTPMKRNLARKKRQPLTSSLTPGSPQWSSRSP